MLGQVEAWTLGIASSAIMSLCDGHDIMGPAADLLRGAHLRIMEIEWVPFAIRDTTTPLGWRGFDIDLLNSVSRILGFSFEIVEAVRAPAESYSELLLRTVDGVDMWASWWLRDQERMNETSMLFGHIDASPVLVAPPPTAEVETSLTESMITFFLPFSWVLWVCLVAMIIDLRHHARLTALLRLPLAQHEETEAPPMSI